MTDDATIQKRMIEVIGQARRNIEEENKNMKVRDQWRERNDRRIALHKANQTVEAATEEVKRIARGLVSAINHEVQMTAKRDALAEQVKEDQLAEKEEEAKEVLRSIPVEEKR